MRAIDLTTSELSNANLATQTRMTMENCRLMLGDLRLSLDHVIKVNAKLSDVLEFAAWNDVFLAVFDAPYPCRNTVGAALVAGKIEVEIIAATTARR